MKKLLAVLALSTLLLASCGTSEEATETPAMETPATTEGTEAPAMEIPAAEAPTETPAQ